jgi:glutaredoxin
MSVTFYSMPGCGFCVKAKQMFAAELASGQMVEKPSSQAPQGTRGFPTFTANDKTHSGLPSSKDELYKKLGISKEGYYRESFHSSYKNPSMFWGVY